MIPEKLSVVDGKLSADPLAGFDNTKILEKQPIFNLAECEKEIKGENNARIVLGRDREHGIVSGYGGLGHTRSGAIDLVVGLQGWNPAEGGYFQSEGPNSSKFMGVSLEDGNFNFAGATPASKGPWIPGIADRNFGSMNRDLPGDAARIYISQRADIDDYFDLCDGSPSGRSVESSAIGIKADSIRIMSRKGIKLVTGKNPPGRTSLDGKLLETYGIDLIAGNRDINTGKFAKLLDELDVNYLQPLVKGENLQEALQVLTDKVANLNVMVQAVFTALPLAIGELQAPRMIIDPTGGILFSHMMSKFASTNLITTTQAQSIQMGIQRTALNLYKVDYLTDKGAMYINSRYNRTN